MDVFIPEEIKSKVKVRLYEEYRIKNLGLYQENKTLYWQECTRDVERKYSEWEREEMSRRRKASNGALRLEENVSAPTFVPTGMSQKGRLSSLANWLHLGRKR